MSWWRTNYSWNDTVSRLSSIDCEDCVIPPAVPPGSLQ
jgi:hypothetical protein